MGAVACPVEPSLTCLDDAAGSITYTGSWKTLVGTSGFGLWTNKTATFTSGGGDTATFIFTGTSQCSCILRVIAYIPTVGYLGAGVRIMGS